MMKAFPIVIDRETQLAHEMESAITEGGMDLRDYFAGKVLPILIEFYPEEDLITNPVFAARKSYRYADAMMKARNHE